MNVEVNKNPPGCFPGHPASPKNFFGVSPDVLWEAQGVPGGMQGVNSSQVIHTLTFSHDFLDLERKQMCLQVRNKLQTEP